MRMAGFFATGRFDHTIKGYEFGNYNSSHVLFFVKLANVVSSNRGEDDIKRGKCVDLIYLISKVI
jgi:hypothetical protein